MGYTGMYCCEWYGFQAVYSGIGFIIDQKVWVQIIGYRFLVEDVGLDQGNWELALKNIKKVKSVLFWLGCASDLSSFWKTATLGQEQGGFGEFSLVQGSKIHLNQLWYRLQGPGSQWHISPKNSPGPVPLKAFRLQL